MNTFFIISNSVIFRIGMKAMINSIEGFLVVAEGNGAIDITNYPAASKARFFIIDIDDLDIGSSFKMELIRANHVDAKIMGISKFQDKDAIIKQYWSGMEAMLHVSSDIETIKLAVKDMNAGKKYFTPVAAEIIEQEYRMQDHRLKTAEKIKSFNAKEIEIIKLCCQQKTSKEIGKSIFLCEKTVDYHRQKIISKMDVKNMVGMVIYAIKNNMVSLDEI